MVLGVIQRFLPTGEEYVEEKSLNNLKLYKYSSVDKSPVSKYILRHYWDWAVGLFPLWMAPNLITLIGLCFEVANVLLVLLLMPDLEGPGPTWLYFSFGLSIWLYSTFDNVDGRQARRTNSSSPLGELFDHGCDALNCSIASVIQAAALGIGSTKTTLLAPLFTTFMFYFSTWEEYHTGTLYLGYFNGPTEGIILSCIACFLSGIYGPEIWHVPAHKIIPIIGSSISEDMSIATFVLVSLAVLAFFLHVLICVKHVYEACEEKGKDFYSTLPETIPFFLFAFSCSVWGLSSKIILPDNHIVLFILTTGIVFGRMTTKIILAHLTKTGFPYFTVQMVPIIIGAVFSCLNLFTPTSELVFLWASFVFVAFAYIHWATLVIDILCTFIGIQCFSISYTMVKN